ncbi:hypothetical protein JYU34_006836 [Plutella xylostella]|uniref:Serine protease nudel n=1 Tax=Plutella xylostella TaxID=51655 RepID=A0ABQ7QT13_PLUXY|nr:hypothetical protein JYU34_006836 [Plutella xylostella]
MNEKVQLEKTLGLPPMELAEGTTYIKRESGSNIAQKCFHPWLKRALQTVLLTACAVGTFVVLLRLLQSTDSNNKSTEIIVVTGLRDSPNITVQQHNFEIILQLRNKTSNRSRRKRSITSKQDLLATFKLHEEVVKKARNIVMNHDKPCNSDTQDSICRDLVHKLDLVTKKRSAGHTNEGLKNHEDVLTSAKESDTVVEDVNHEGDNIMDANEGEDHHDHGFQARSQYPGPAYPDPGPSYPIVAPAPIADTCLLARLLKHNPQQLHAYHVPYHGRAVSDVQEHEDHNVHPQDIEILRSHTTTPRITLTNESLSSTREADCPIGSVSCEDGGSCVAQKQWCDGLVDCADASDEARCTCKARVDKSRLCDGYYDCPFGEDEMGCFGCSEDTFSCEDLDLNSRSSCFSREQRCDNTADCPNRKDELECNLLAPSLHDKPMFAVSNTEGFLQRNFRGTWFPVCNNPYMWAHDACRRETGLIIRPPYIQMVPIDPRLKVTYLNTGPGGVQMSDSCVNSSAVYVTCPDLLCGTRVLTTPQFLRENAAFENHLFGRNKRFLLRNPRYPIVYFNRSKRHVNNTFSRNSMAEENVPYIDGGIRGWRDKRAETRVVGGRPSQPAAWPWMIALYRNGMFHCGGVVISQKWVVSAAHCVHKFWEHYYEIQVGMLRRFSFSPQESNHRVTHVIVNQHYDRVDMKNDLSLLRVTPSIQFSRWVRPICLPGPDTAGPDWKWGPPSGTSCVAVGWGATVEHGPDPDHMREVEVPIWGQCKHREDRAGKEICAGPVEGGKDACQGDSGGPLLCRNPLNAQQWYMAGIVSHGDGCARKGEPGVYTRVSLFVKWIKFHIFSKTLPGIQPKQECPGFKCISGIAKCLPKNRMCDKIIDCLDGEDEMNCNIDSPLHGADKNMFISENTVEKRNNFETKEAETESPTVKNTTQGSKDIIEDTDISETKSIHTVSHQATMRDNLDSAGTVSRGDIETISISVTKDPLESRSMMIDSQKKNEELRESDIPENFDDFTTTITTQSPEKNSITTLSDTTEDFSQSVEQETQSVENESQEIGIKNPQTKSTTEKIHAEHDSDSTEEKDHSKERKINKEDQEATDTTTTDSSSVANTDLIDSTTQKIIITTRSETDDLDDKESKTFSLDLPLDESDLTNNHHVNKHDQNSDLSSEPESKSIVDKVKGLVLAKYLVPANIKKKHRVPKFFECLRINQSIPYHHRCNHKADCEDGTDELDCSCVDYVTTFDEKLICDGVVDCADGHDELNCYSCADDHFLCKISQTCLPLSFVCDKKPQCPQGEDELDCFALSNGKNIEIDFDGRPKVALEGYITRRNRNNWNIVCEDKLSFDRQEAAASHICRYLGFSAANSYHVKYINIKDEILTESNTDFRRKRDASTVPISFMYRTAEEDSDKARNIVIRDPQVIKEQCVPNITKTCMSLYVSCELNLYSEFTEFYELENDIAFRQADGKAVRRLWPWVAKVFVEGEYRCTGVLVDLSWVLVSHSCLWDSMLIQNYITVVLGAQRTLKATHGPYEQIYQVNGKKELYHSKAALLHLKEPASYSRLVKPMVVPAVTTHSEENDAICVAVGQDDNNKTVSVFLKETEEGCDLHSKCFKRHKPELICPADMKSRRSWSGIVSCHSARGWAPAASFVEAGGECGFGDRIVGVDVDNLRSEIKHASGKVLSTSTEQVTTDACDGIRCRRGKCIKFSKLCDDVRDCEDGYDESDTACMKKQTVCEEDPHHRGCECTSGQMKCKNGRCIAKELFGDGNNDCYDGSDEPGRVVTCAQYLSRVMPLRLCDGVLHCDDKSDEDPMFCKCFSKKSYKCGSTEHCVAPDLVCDGSPDCPHKEDEATCMAISAPEGTPYGTGEVIVRSHGVWHSKCYPKENHTRSELEDICRQLGFISGHAKQLKVGQKSTFHPVTKVVLEPFTEVVLNNNTRIKLRNSDQPLARAVVNEDLENCYPVYIECL